MNTQQAIQAIKTKPLQPFYLVIGTDNYLIEEVKQAFIQRLGLQKDDMDLVFFDMEQDLINQAVAEAQTPSLFSESGQRLIFVENPYFLTAEKKTNVPEQDLTDFLDYLKAPDPSAILVLIARVEKLDERKKVTKAAKKAGEVIEAKPLGESDARRYLQQTIDGMGLEFDRGAFESFLQLTELDLSKAMQELNKIQLYAGDDHKITRKTVEALVPKSLADNIFSLTDYILSGNADAALRLYDDLRLQGEETIKLNAIIIGQIRLLLQIQILAQQGYQQANIAKTLRLNPYRVKMSMGLARKIPFGRLTDLYDELVENDYLVKTGQMDKELLFQLFVLKAAG